MQALARKTLNIASKHAQSRQSQAKTYVPLLAELYTEGSATVRIFGLQRVGFNERLFQILRRAYDKRDRERKASADVPGSAEAGVASSCTQGKKRDLVLELLGEPEGAESEWNVPGPAKVPRLDEGAELHDEMTVWRA